jgi:hypothetical protein
MASSFLKVFQTIAPSTPSGALGRSLTHEVGKNKFRLFSFSGMGASVPQPPCASQNTTDHLINGRLSAAFTPLQYAICQNHPNINPTAYIEAG